MDLQLLESTKFVLAMECQIAALWMPCGRRRMRRMNSICVGVKLVSWRRKAVNQTDEMSQMCKMPLKNVKNEGHWFEIMHLSGMVLSTTGFWFSQVPWMQNLAGWAKRSGQLVSLVDLVFHGSHDEFWVFAPNTSWVPKLNKQWLAKANYALWLWLW